jgi:hypothetical protein
MRRQQRLADFAFGADNRSCRGPLVRREDRIKDHSNCDERHQPRHRADVRNTGRVQRHINQPRDQVGPGAVICPLAFLASRVGNEERDCEQGKGFKKVCLRAPQAASDDALRYRRRAVARVGAGRLPDRSQRLRLEHAADRSVTCG